MFSAIESYKVVWAIVPFQARIVKVKVTLGSLSDYVILSPTLPFYVTPKRHHESTRFGKVFGSQDVWLFVNLTHSLCAFIVVFQCELEDFNSLESSCICPIQGCFDS